MSSQLHHNRPPTALQVADYMLATAKLDYGLNLDQLQLNKMLYMVNGFVLKDRDEPAFRNPVEAWKYGPVIRMVWETYKDWGDKQIDTLDMCLTSLDNTDALENRRTEMFKIIGQKVAGIVSGVIHEYGTCTGGELIDITHRKGTPWAKAYKPGRNNIIPKEAIAKFYRNISSHDAR